MSSLPEYKAEATPEGVNLLYLEDNGLYEQLQLITYLDAIKEVDEGHHDDYLPSGLMILQAVLEGHEKEYFFIEKDKGAVIWRWLVVYAFVSEQLEKNGTVTIKQEDGSDLELAVYVGEKGAIPIYPSAERFSLANHIESLAIEHFKDSDPMEKAIFIYQQMLGRGLKLSEWGREGLALIHDGFIESLASGDLSEFPAMH